MEVMKVKGGSSASFLVPSILLASFVTLLMPSSWKGYQAQFERQRASQQVDLTEGFRLILLQNPFPS